MTDYLIDDLNRISCEEGSIEDRAVQRIVGLGTELAAANKLRHDQILSGDKALTKARDTGEGYRQELLQSVGDRRCELLAHEHELAAVQLNVASMMKRTENYMAMKDELAAARKEIYVLRQFGNKDCTSMADEELARPTGDHP